MFLQWNLRSVQERIAKKGEDKTSRREGYELTDDSNPYVNGLTDKGARMK